jgi:hypothetical protein
MMSTIRNWYWGGYYASVAATIGNLPNQENSNTGAKPVEPNSGGSGWYTPPSGGSTGTGGSTSGGSTSTGGGQTGGSTSGGSTSGGSTSGSSGINFIDQDNDWWGF